MTAQPGCSESLNVVCKHARGTNTFYLDLSWLPDGVTVSNASATTEDANITIENVEALSADVVDPNCSTATLTVARAILLLLSGGLPDDDEVIITVCWDQSDGDTDCRDCRLLVQGTA